MDNPEGAARAALSAFELPLQTRQGRFQPGTLDQESRTVELTWTTGATVRRVDWMDGRYDEELVVSPKTVRMARLQNGANLLDSHEKVGIRNILGVIERAWIDGGEGRALVRFSDRDEVEPVWRDVQTGILRHVSVGYQIHRVEKIERDKDVPLMRATDWEPVELSLCSVPADAGAHVRSQTQALFPVTIQRAETMDTTSPEAAAGAVEISNPAPENEDRGIMDQERISDGAAGPPQPDLVAGERARVLGIQKAAKYLNISSGVVDRLIADGVSLEDARTAMIDQAAARADADRIVTTGVRVQAGQQDENRTRHDAIVSALLHRAFPGSFALSEAGREYIGLPQLEIARGWLAADGVRVRGLSRSEIAQMVLIPGHGVRDIGGLHTTSDFPNVLLDVTNKSLRRAYEQAPQTFKGFSRQGTLPDFRAMKRIQIGENPTLLKKNEGGEYVRGTIGDAAELIMLTTYARMFGITREAIVNDDLDAFTRVPAAFGASAANKESDVVWGLILANAAMGDGTALFHANHGNLTTSGSGAPSITTVAAAKAKMSKQTGLDGVSLLNVQARYLIVPSELELAAAQLVTSITPNLVGSVVPDYIRSLIPVAEPRLSVGVTLDGTTIAGSAAVWYLAADPGQIDTIEYAYLEGEQGVMVDSRPGWNVDGLEIRARLDFGAKAIDWRGLFRDNGVA